MKSLQKVFNYNEQQVRTLLRNDEPWFVAKDICDVLDLGDVSKAVGRLDEDEKGTNSIPTPGGNQKVLIVNEPGLYSLILSSRKPEARQFKRWITHEVLPSIRKTGSYEAPGSSRRADAMLLNAKTRQAKTMIYAAKEFKNILSPESVQLLLAGATELMMGKALLSKPQIDVRFSISEIAEELGITPNRLGRIATKHNLRQPDFGFWVLDKAAHSDKHVRAFLYNIKGRQALIDAYNQETKVVTLAPVQEINQEQPQH